MAISFATHCTKDEHRLVILVKQSDLNGRLFILSFK